MPDKLIIATRKSQLALWQANFIAQRLRDAHPTLVVELQPMATQGDRWLSSPLSEVGGKGLFIKELESAMLAGQAHLAVQSMKDVPAILPEGFVLGAVGFRDDAMDALVCPTGADLDSLPVGAKVGSASLRRQALLRSRRDDLNIVPVRGNVNTRLQKLDDGEYDALVLASTGLTRLGLQDRITATLDPRWCVPAVGQGALGVECLVDDAHTRSLVACLNDSEVQACVSAERALSAELSATCSTPLGGHARWVEGQLQLEAVLAALDGRRVLRAQGEGHDPQALGQELAQRLLAAGAADILASLDARG